jgi:hypothetical protein
VTQPARIACVYGTNRPDDIAPAMDHIRFRRMAEALARRGHQVDVLMDVPEPVDVAQNLRYIPYRSADFAAYDVIKTSFHRGFQNLQKWGGGDHPFIVSKLGSVVGSGPVPGVHFFGSVREGLYEIQLQVAAHSRYVTVLTDESARLWRNEHGDDPPLLMVPTGVDAVLPPLGLNPYLARGIAEPVVLFAGHVYDRDKQGEVNAIWQDRLNRLGSALKPHGLRLVAMGSGLVDRLDPELVLHVGQIDAAEFWDWQRHASVGVVVAHGAVQDNESSKIYYYLRTALPIVCERPVPNAWLIEQMGCGRLVDLDDMEGMAQAAADLVRKPPDTTGLPERMARDFSWDARAALYDQVIAEAVAERAAIG